MCGKREASLCPLPVSEDIIQPVGKTLPWGGTKEGCPHRMGSEGLQCARERAASIRMGRTAEGPGSEGGCRLYPEGAWGAQNIGDAGVGGW